MSPILATPTDLLAADLPTEAPRCDWMDTLARLAALQHGVVAGWQALTMGVDEIWLRHAVRRKYLHVVGEGLYAVGHANLSRRGRAVVAVLRAGPGSAISHVSAARLWELVEQAQDGPIHVSLGARRGLSSNDEVIVHRPRHLLADDVCEHRGVPVTTPERTLLDLLPDSSVGQTTRMLEQMVTQLRRSPDDLHAWGHQVRRAQGLPKLHAALDHVVGPKVLRSELERRFRTLCQHAGLPMPETNVRLGRWEVDVLWRRLGVAVELDSWRWHGGRWQFHRDREKGLAISRAGFELLRLTWPQVKDESREVVDTLRVVLARAETRLAA